VVLAFSALTTSASHALQALALLTLAGRPAGGPPPPPPPCGLGNHQQQAGDPRTLPRRLNLQRGLSVTNARFHDGITGFAPTAAIPFPPWNQFWIGAPAGAMYGTEKAARWSAPPTRTSEARIWNNSPPSNGRPPVHASWNHLPVQARQWTMWGFIRPGEMS